MHTTRRTFLAAATGGALAGPGMARRLIAAQGEPATTAPADKLDILILGGTGFLGPALVEAALARGHAVTLFNRGRTNTHLFPDVPKLRGDRDPDKDEGLSALADGKWDVVIDTSAYVPRIAGASATLLADRVEHYLFVSTISVYASHDVPGADEDAPLGTLDDPAVEDVDGQTYGPLKALCEQAVEAAMPGRVAVVRPGLIVGPRDSTDRFTYWPVRVARGGEVLAPGAPEHPVQYIDVRDLAEWSIRVSEARTAGVFNAVGPAKPLTIGTFLDACNTVTGDKATFTWVDADFLAAHEVAPWMEMTMWVPPVDDYAGFASSSNQRAIDAGLTFRPLPDTIKATLAWFEGLPEERRAKMRAGLDSEKEKRVLAAWHARDEAGATTQPG